jgi:acetyl-CoA C-acetyltransferase
VPCLRLRSWAVAGVDPRRFGIAPVPATLLALDRAGATLGDLDVIELNEAFAVQVLACLADWHVDPEDPRVNPRGSGISLGHPIGATGIRILATLAHELPAVDGTLAVETLCIGGGQALAAVLERV